MAQTKKRSLVDEVLDDALQVRETALANAKLALEEAFEPRIKSMISRHLQTEMEQEDEMEDEMEEEYGDDEEMEEEYGDEEMEEEYEDPTNADDATLGEEEEEEEMTSEEEEEEEMTSEEEEEEDLDLESVIAELEAELGDEEESEEDEMEMDLEDEMEMDSEEEDEEIIDLEELLSALSEEEDEEEVTEEEDEEEEAELAQENKRLASELAEHREALTILRSKLNEVNLLNAKLLYTTKLFRKYNLSNNQKMKVVESFDRTKSVRETKLVYSTLAESLSIGAKSNTSVRKISITEGFASKPTKSTKPKTNIINESNDVADRFRRLVNYNK